MRSPAPLDALQVLPSPAEFEERYVLPGRPVVLAGAATDVASDPRWQLDALEKRFSERDVLVTVSDSEVFHADGRDLREQVRFGDFLRDDVLHPTSTGTRHRYLQEARLRECFPELDEELALFSLARGRSLYEVMLWLGGASISTLHFDAHDNFYRQIHGEKRFVLAAPTELTRLYPRGLETDNGNKSEFTYGKSDPSKTPLVHDVTWIEAKLRPGDVLWLPAYWWHQVESDAASLSLSTWVRARPIGALVPAARRMLAVTTAPLSLLQFAVDADDLGPMGMATFAIERGDTALGAILAFAVAEARISREGAPGAKDGAWLKALTDELAPVRRALYANPDVPDALPFARAREIVDAVSKLEARNVVR